MEKSAILVEWRPFYCGGFLLECWRHFVTEIISHISFGDKYIREEMLLQMKSNAVIKSVDFDTLNNQAANYALSGVSQEHLLEKQLEEKTQLVSVLR